MTVKATKNRHAGRGETDKRLDRALTVGGYTPSGRFKSNTAKLYAEAWRDFDTWCRSSGRTSMPATPSTMAEYAMNLIDRGYVPATARSRITAVRARHRQLGHPVPDNLPAWGVLQGVEHTPRPTPDISRDALLAAVSTCPTTPAGRRNRAIVLLAWDLTCPAPHFLALNIEDVHLAGDDQPARITLPTRAEDVAIHHDHSPIDLCPVCAVREWIQEMASVGITEGPLFRPVDRLGVIEGCGIRRAGGPITRGDARLSYRSLYRVWTRLIAQSGIEASTPRALRVGGARDRVRRTGDVGQALCRAGWSPTTGAAVSRLLPT